MSEEIPVIDRLADADQEDKPPFMIEPGEFVYDPGEVNWYQVHYATEVHERKTVLAVSPAANPDAGVTALKKYRNSTTIRCIPDGPGSIDQDPEFDGEELNQELTNQWKAVGEPEESIRALREGDFYYHSIDDQWYEIAFLKLVKNTMVAAVTLPDSDIGIVGLYKHHDSNAYRALTADFENPVEVTR